MASGEDNDSGMSSQNSKADTPEKTLAIEGADDDEDDETISERLWGLTEMFPNPVRYCLGNVVTGTVGFVKGSFTFSKQVAWILTSSALLLMAPVMFEVERANAQEAFRQQQQQVLLGPNAAGGPQR